MKNIRPLISQDQDVRASSVYAGYLILSELRGKNRISIFDLYQTLRTQNRAFNYSTAMYALIFLYMSGLVDFDEPYIYNNKQ